MPGLQNSDEDVSSSEVPDFLFGPQKKKCKRVHKVHLATVTKLLTTLLKGKAVPNEHMQQKDGILVAQMFQKRRQDLELCLLILLRL